MLIGLATPARAQLSPRVRMVARGQLPARALAAPRRERALVTIRVAGGAERLRALGISAQRITDDIAAAELDSAALAWLATALPDEPLVIEERHLLHPTLDRAGPAIGAPAARAATGLTGRGVLIGIVDSGIDFRHRDLRNLDGSSRVQALLDRRTLRDRRHAALGDFGGAIWHKSEIDAALTAEAEGRAPRTPVAQRDFNGHGTHVAAIAASNGRATTHRWPTGRYVGVAPEADLVIAQASDENDNYTDVGVLEACRFLVTEQTLLGRPMVVNMSLGGSGGPHDGSTNLELAIDQLFPREQPGRALVISAGNDGGRDLHAGGWALDGEVALPLAVHDGEDGILAAEIWYRGEVAISVEGPSGRRTGLAHPGRTVDVTLSDEARVIIDNASEGAQASGLRGAGIVLQGLHSTPPKAGRWVVHLEGAAVRYDAWLLDAPVSNRSRFVDGIVADDHLSVPGTAKSAITVGALTSRYDWSTVDGRAFEVAGSDAVQLGWPTFFSASGPSADGRFAPDLAAPGEFVIAAMSADAPPTSPRSVFAADPTDPSLLWADDGLHGVLRGTSQAAPLVTGAIALLFEAAPQLTSETVREILHVTAAPVPSSPGWSPRAGFGRLDVGAALSYLRGTRGGAPSARTSRVGVSRDLLPPQTEETTRVTVTPRDEAGLTLGAGHTVTIDLDAGEALGPVLDLGSGRYERSFVAHAPRGAVGMVHATVDGVALDEQPRVFFVRSRGEVGGDLTAGGGCTVGGGTSATPLLFLVYLLGLRRRRARASC